MCGIAGIWRPGGPAPAWSEMVGMLSAMGHRGPEGAAACRMDRGRLLLGFLALGFTDTPGSLQPLFNEDQTLALVYNGEIYDHAALRDELEACGHRFATRSDSEVLIHLHEQEGDAMLDRLNGEFAFVLWDEARRTLTAVRDRYGVKPLVYVELPGGGVAFASEAKALLSLPGVDAALDPLYLSGPGVGLADTSRTPFLGLRKVRPGHFRRWTTAGGREHRWWRPEPAPRSWSRLDAQQALRATLRTAVERRAGGEVPLGISLSSGIDSTIVSGLVAEVRGSRPTFTLSYPGRPFDEAATAARTARAHGHTPIAVPCPIDRLGERFLASIHATELATNSLSTVARMELAAAVQGAGLKALTGGEGADELFGGYPYFGLEAIWREGDPAVRRSAERAFQASEALSVSVFWDRRPGGAQAREALGMDSVYAGRVQRAAMMQRLLYTPDLLARAGSPAGVLADELDLPHLRTVSPFDRTRTVARSVLGTFAIPALGDPVEMSASLEGRVPFLDRDVVALAFSFPEALCVEPGTFRRKAILRDACADLIPTGHTAPPKHIWMAPTFAELRRTPVGRALLHDHLDDAAVARTGWLRRGTVRALRHLARLLPPSHPRTLQLDSLVGWCLSIQALHHVFIDSPHRFAATAPVSVQDRTPGRGTQAGTAREGAVHHGAS